MVRFLSRLFPRLSIYAWLVFSQSPDARWARLVFQAGLVRRWSAFRRNLTLGGAIFAVRDVITVTKVPRNTAVNLGSLAAPANGAAFTQSNGQTFSGIKRSSKFCLLVYNSKAGAIVITVKAGAYPPAEDAGLGDYSYTCPTTVFFTLIGPLDGSRFLQANGTINVDTDASATGTMWAFEMSP